MLQVEIYRALPGFTLEVSFEAENLPFALLGASGCGKSMTLQCIAGILKPDRGRIVLDGRVLFDSRRGINLPPQKRRAGLLFQNYALFPNMTVEGNILAALRGRKMGRRGREQRLLELLAAFHLEDQRRHYPAHLSGGQQQRAALARMLAGDPALIMLDEPLSALDSFLRWQVEEELQSLLAGFPGTALYVSHNRGEVYRLCKKVCVLQRGKSEGVFPVKGFFEEPGTLSAARLSGCRNFSRARRLSDTRVLALDWGLELECRTVPPGLRYLGIRAHRISPSEEQNRFRCRILRIREDLFSLILTLIPEGVLPRGPVPGGFAFDGEGEEGVSPCLRMEIHKVQGTGLVEGESFEVGTAPGDVLLLE